MTSQRFLNPQTARFLYSVSHTVDLPALKQPEIAFFGSSNVGKSSLINAVFQRKNLARSSKTPGRTQLLNFFFVDPCLTLVDAPGYGFAKVPPSVQKDWEALMLKYLADRAGLIRVYLLMDSRHPYKKNDIATLDLLQQYGMSIQTVLTKTDKLNTTERRKLEESLAQTGQPMPYLTSVQSKDSLNSLLQDIESYALS